MAAVAGTGGRPYAAGGKTSCPHSTTMSEGFLHDAEAALAVFRDLDRPRRGRRIDPNMRLKTLTFSLDERVYRAAKPYWLLKDNVDQADDDDRVCGLALAHPIASELEELRLHGKEYGQFRYRPRLELLSGSAATLRVLELKHCKLDPPTSRSAVPSSGLALPRLTDLRLERCCVSGGFLQVVLDAATALTKLVMVNVKHRADSGQKDFGHRFRLRCEMITDFVLNTRGCKVDHDDLANRGIELDMSNLRSFSYNGFPVKISLTSPSPELRRVDLDATRYDKYHQVIVVKHYEPTLGMIRSFSSTRALTLNIHCVEELAAAGDVTMPTFPNLKLLDLTAEYDHMENDDTQLAMARLLGSCPAISELRLALKMKPNQRHRQSKNNDPPGGAFGASMDRFNRLAAMAYVQGGNSIKDSYKITKLAALMSGCTLGCLSKVTLRFEANEVNCFPVQLAKFIVENAMVLKEMRINDSTQFWTEHLHNNVARWRANSFRRKNLPVTCNFSVFRA